MSIKNRGTLVSFIGSRGSGKTTVAELVCKQLAERGDSCIRQHPGFKRRPFLRGLFTAISLWRFFDLELIISFGFRGRKQRNWPSLYRIYLPLAFAHDLYQLAVGRADILVYDSNILRGLISALARKEIEPDVVTDLYKNKVLSKAKQLIFVVIDTDPAEAVLRWTNRDKIQLSDVEYNTAVAERVKLMQETNAIIDILSKLSQVKIVHLDGGVPPKENADRVVNLITN